MSSKQSTPAMGQTGQLTAGDRKQGAIIGAACQLIEHVEPLPHCLLEHPTQNLVHLAASRPVVRRPSRVPK
jgi:hypothetical protein